jgi:outer membrane protein OmpA-like peptidoglycan-associated protein
LKQTLEGKMKKIMLIIFVLAVVGIFGTVRGAYGASVGGPFVFPETVAPAPAPAPEVAAPAPAEPVEKIVEKQVIVEKRVEVPVDRIVEKIVEKPVEKIVYVDKIVNNTVDKPIAVNIQDVYFPYDSSALGPFNRGILDKNVEVFKAYPKLTAILIGYASPEGTDEYNLKLSERRVAAVKDYLVKAGVPEEILTVKPMGKLEAANKSSWPFARKVHFEPTF